jgi:hypothetical protein
MGRSLRKDQKTEILVHGDQNAPLGGSPSQDLVVLDAGAALAGFGDVMTQVA